MLKFKKNIIFLKAKINKTRGGNFLIKFLRFKNFKSNIIRENWNIRMKTLLVIRSLISLKSFQMSLEETIILRMNTQTYKIVKMIPTKTLCKNFKKKMIIYFI
jgi:hypothetical protein